MVLYGDKPSSLPQKPRRTKKPSETKSGETCARLTPPHPQIELPHIPQEDTWGHWPPGTWTAPHHGLPHRKSPREDLLPKEPVASLKCRHRPWRVAVPAQHPCSQPSVQGCLPTPKWLPRIWWDGLTNRWPLLRGLPNTVQSWPHGLCPTFWPHSCPALLQPHHCLTSGHKHISAHTSRHTHAHGDMNTHRDTHTHTDAGTCVHTHTILTYTQSHVCMHGHLCHHRYAHVHICKDTRVHRQAATQRAPACEGLG